MAGLKSRPFKAIIFSASPEGLPLGYVAFLRERARGQVVSDESINGQTKKSPGRKPVLFGAEVRGLKAPAPSQKQLPKAS
jgi:hypothetical protein